MPLSSLRSTPAAIPVQCEGPTSAYGAGLRSIGNFVVTGAWCGTQSSSLCYEAHFVPQGNDADIGLLTRNAEECCGGDGAAAQSGGQGHVFGACSKNLALGTRLGSAGNFSFPEEEVLPQDPPIRRTESDVSTALPAGFTSSSALRIGQDFLAVEDEKEDHNPTH